MDEVAMNDQQKDEIVTPDEETLDEEGRAFVRPEDGVGFGVDIVELARMKGILDRTPSFSKKVFSEDERAYCDKKKRPEIHYATRFAAKEAVVKALGTGFAEGIHVRDIEVGRTEKGKPFVILHRRAREIAEDQGVLEIPLSLSYTHTEAIACAMTITKGSVRAKEEKIDPMKELAQQFKEVRSILDEVDNPQAQSESAENQASVQS